MMRNLHRMAALAVGLAAVALPAAAWAGGFGGCVPDGSCSAPPATCSQLEDPAFNAHCRAIELSRHHLTGNKLSPNHVV